MKYKQVTAEQLKAAYFDNPKATLRTAAEELGITHNTLFKAIRFHELLAKDGGRALRPRKSKNPFIQDKEWLRRRYLDDDKSIREIANEIHSTVGAVYSALTWAGIPIRNVGEGISKRFPEGRKGSQSTNWHGGRAETKKYILIWNPDHPNAGTTGYIQEHRLIVEKDLGRYLGRKELVHHLNGNTKDNRLENLVVLTQGEHVRHHYSDAKRVAELQEENARLQQEVSRLVALLEAHGIEP